MSMKKLMQAVITRNSVTGALRLANKTPFDTYFNKVGTATYAGDFVAARLCVEHNIELKTL
jgi:hypothetical protein